MGKTSTKAKNKYNAANYDRISLSVPKGTKDAWKAAAADKSLNQFIFDAVESYIDKERSKA